MLNRIWRTAAVAAALAIAVGAGAQRSGELSLNVDAKAFFVNNEFSTPLCKGYTLPGFRFLPTLKYTFTPQAEIEGGLYMMHYWGAHLYPEGTYTGLPAYSATDNSKRFHTMPFLRLRLKSKFGLSLVLGSLDHQGHGLIEPLYASERLLTADPEAGVQLAYSHPRVNAEMWVDWRSFIYNNSPHQENFVFGLNATPLLTRPGSSIRLSLPVQALIEHLGGEVDASGLSGYSLLNAAAGLKLELTPHHGFISGYGAEAYALFCKEMKGSEWPFGSGHAFWARAFAKSHGFDLSVGYYAAHNFASLCGLPIFDSLSAIDGVCLDNPSTIVARLAYEYKVTKGVSMEAFASAIPLFDRDTQVSYIFGVTAKAEISESLWRKKNKKIRLP